MKEIQVSPEAYILLVDDNPDNLKLLEKILIKNGYRVRASSSGRYALKSIENNPPDLILLDVKMPGMDGYEVCRQLKADPVSVNIPIIFISALKEEESKVKGFELGGVDYITKPFHSQEILARVRTHLTIRHMQEHLEEMVEERTAELKAEIIARRGIEKNLRESERELRIRNRIAQIFLAADEADMYQEVLNNVLEVMESEFGIFGYISEDGALVCPSMTRDVWEKCQIPDKDIVFPRETWGGIWGRALIEKKSLYSNETFAVPEGHIPIANALDVPLIHQEKVIGNLMVANKATDYDEKDKELLELIANHVSPIMAARLQRDRQELARTEAEKAIRKERDKAQMYLDVAGVMLMAINDTGEVTLINEKGCEVLGYSEGEVIGKNWFDNFLPEQVREEIISVSKKLLDGEVAPVTYYENPIVTKTGEEKTIAWHNTILKNDNGRIIGHFSSGADITEQKHREAEKAKLEEQLRQTQKMEAIGLLAGGIAHDFNNILGSVFGYTELAMDCAEKGSLLEDYLAELFLAAKRAKDLVQQILVFSCKTEQELKPVRIKLITKEALKLLRASLPSSIEIHQNIRSDSLVMCDPTQIHQVMINLCTNAGHAMEKTGGILDIRLEEGKLNSGIDSMPSDTISGPYIQLTVSDTGHGMPPEVLDKIFYPFFTTKEKGEGTGLGLSVVHGIVTNFGGTINVTSEVGKGTTFKVYFPVSKRTIGVEIEKEEPILKGSERILFVDDELTLTKIAQPMLQSLGYEVTTRLSSIDALALFKAKPEAFDLVITDMTMPNMTGDELAKELMAVRPDIPIILCTGFSAGITKEKAKALGIRSLVSKPILKRDIAEAIRKVLDGK